MDLSSKKTSLVILGITALICSRMVFFFFSDREGPNLLIVAGLAAALYVVSFAVYVFGFSKMKWLTPLLVAICVQVLVVVGIYFCMK